MQPPIRVVVDLDVGESREVKIADGSSLSVELLNLEETRDNVTHGVGRARVRLRISGEEVEIGVANYNYPKTLSSCRVDCSVTGGLRERCNLDFWKLKKDARIRLWPKSGPLIEPGSLVMPIERDFFSTFTQMANEPCFINNATFLPEDRIYYHSGLDFGGVEGEPVLAACDALVISSRGETLKEKESYLDSEPRYDRIHLLDERGWVYRYSHMRVIDEGVEVGTRVKVGQKVGEMGKEGTSGGWCHLHFEINAPQPSGENGTEEAYAYLLEDYLRSSGKSFVANARPHLGVRVGEKARLSAANSVSARGETLEYRWLDGDREIESAEWVKQYEKPGLYCETLKVRDAQGNEEIDFVPVVVIDELEKDARPNTVHIAHFPTRDIKAGDEVQFALRSFLTESGEESIDFGDGSPVLTLKSDGGVDQLAEDGYERFIHSFGEPGKYVVTVTRTGHLGTRAESRLIVDVVGD